MATTHFKGPLSIDGNYVNGDAVSGKTSAYTVLDTDNGKHFYSATDNMVFTLPSATAGLSYTFTNTGADGAAKISISPAAADAIHGTITLAASVVELSGTDNKDLINTKATATTGNSVTIFSDGTDWYVLNSTGIWASEV
jgi:hypothetical protein